MQETLLASQRLAMIHELRDRHSRLKAVDRAALAWKRREITEEQIDAEQHKRRCRESFEYFVKALWHVVEPGRPLVWNWHMSAICHALERVTRREITRLLINVPPGHSKSLLVSVFWPAWQWLEDPNWGGLFVSYQSKLAERDARKCRLLIRSADYRALIPKVYGPGWDRAWEMKDDTDSVALYENEYGGGRVTTSVTGGGTGWRATDLVIDDPMNAEEYPTQEALQSIIDWYNTRMSSRFRDMDKGAIVIIMQRLHTRDLAGHVLEQDELQSENPDWPKFTKIVFPSEFDPATASEYDQRTVKGELLFKERFSERVIAEAKIKLGPRGYAAQHDQRPVPASGGLLPVGHFRYWWPRGMPEPHAIIATDENGNAVGAVQIELPTKWDEEWLSVDCAFKDKKDSDFAVLQVQARVAENYFVLEQERGRFSFGELKDRMRAIAGRRRNMGAKYVEDKANGSAVISDLRDEIAGFIPVDPEGGKEARAHAISYIIRSGNVYLPHPFYFPWVKEFLIEATNFPLGSNDDQVDAFTQGLNQGIRNNTSYMQIMTAKTQQALRGGR